MQGQPAASSEFRKAVTESVALDTACHEAGHIALALNGCYVPFGASIVPADRQLGAMFHRPGTGNLNDVQTWRKMGWGGVSLRTMALHILGGAAVDRRRGLSAAGCENDSGDARRALHAPYGSGERASDELSCVLAEAQAIVAGPEVWRAIELIAGELYRRRELRGRHMLRLMLKAAPMIHGWDRAREEMRLWRGYPELAESADRDPLYSVSLVEFLPAILWPIGAVIAALLMHAIWGR